MLSVSRASTMPALKRKFSSGYFSMSKIPRYGSRVRIGCSARGSQRQPYTPFSYTRWVTASGLGPASGVVTWSTGGTSTILRVVLFATTEALNSQRLVRCLNGDSETVFNYIWTPTVAQPFLTLRCPLASSIQSITAQSPSTDAITAVIKFYENN